VWRSDEFHLLLSGSSTSTVIHRADRPTIVESGDYNGDGLLDLALGSQGYGPTESRVQLMFGDGEGNFSIGPQINVPAQLTAISSVPQTVLSPDGFIFQFDTLAVLSTDVSEGAIAPNASTSDLHSFLDSYGFSSPSFGSSNTGFEDVEVTLLQRQTLGVGATNMKVGDINQDGLSDLAIVESGSRQVDLLLGESSGDFNLVKSSADAAAPVAIAFGNWQSSLGRQLLHLRAPVLLPKLLS
jgi:hypothetical protein